MDYETLDPEDWAQTQKLAHALVDSAIDYTKNVRDRPVWRDMPGDIRDRFLTDVPKTATPLADILRDVDDTVMAYPMGNTHPRFWAWYMGTSNFTGAMADFIAAVQGSNLGGGNHAAALMDQQVVQWLRQMIGMPEGASGTLVSGGSVANLIGLTVARNTKAGIDIREEGLMALPAPLRFYGSDQMHSCHQQAMETLGLGNKALFRIRTGGDMTMDLEALKFAVADDRANGVVPACVIATAGTVNTGAIDNLAAIADFCHEQDIWLHVDGCIGALVAIAPENRWRVEGIERADSIALDPHKWLHAPFEVGCALIRSRTAHLSTFSLTPEYLKTANRGLAAAQWLHDFGIQTSRGFRALKVWMSLREHGVEKFGRLIDQDIAKGAHLSRLVEEAENLHLMFPTSINIVCFRYDPGGLDEAELKALNIEIMLRLQENGIAVLSDTTVHGQHCLRAAINNHRTANQDLQLVVREVQNLAAIVLKDTAGS
ncbi:PLP-dependent enzyme, glutamate decarboxylase [Hoeflea sp. IMCC20628]|uniref:pyridoxal phosphate-dependent decarboxylase family protein n=1 Tax=Hoeflea sp. IMCC20628 TaxID=1620421 RepID=UPI00063B099C|nr:pyridoxal-dependent decarboxylase [Hoeflea sp. IMCC20628]AKI01349.1 PLP-dependent enzyme, glutamate decarboxylase [Hoeflea sp. IMCC20628]